MKDKKTTAELLRELAKARRQAGESDFTEFWKKYRFRDNPEELVERVVEASEIYQDQIMQSLYPLNPISPASMGLSPDKLEQLPDPNELISFGNLDNEVIREAERSIDSAFKFVESLDLQEILAQYSSQKWLEEFNRLSIPSSRNKRESQRDDAIRSLRETQRSLRNTQRVNNSAVIFLSERLSHLEKRQDLMEEKLGLSNTVLNPVKRKKTNYVVCYLNSTPEWSRLKAAILRFTRVLSDRNVFTCAA